MTLLFLGLRGPQLIFIAFVILLVFGAGRIPQIMRNLGKGVHAFRQGVEDAKAEINKDITPAATAQPKDKIEQGQEQK